YLTADNVQLGLVLGSAAVPLDISEDFDATEVYDADYFSLSNQDYEAQATGLYTVQFRLDITMTGTTSGSRIRSVIQYGTNELYVTYNDWTAGNARKVVSGTRQIFLNTGDKVSILTQGYNS